MPNPSLPLLDDAFARLQQAASHAATSHHNDRSDPTPAQAEAGNYKKARHTLHGLPLVLENVRNSVRAGTSEDGKTWTNRLAAHYGEIAGTKGNDGDPVDVFIGLFPESLSVWVINQGWPDGGFDEHKVCLAFCTEQQARDAYLMSFDRDWTGLRSMVRCTVNQLKWWLKNGDMSRPLTLDQLPFDGATTMKTLWTPDAQPIGTPLHKLMYDLRVDDGAGLMLDAVSMTDIMGDPDIQALPLFDALVVEVNRMTVKMNVLQRTMDAAGGAVKVSGYQISDPIKARGVMQVAVLFALSDGQTVTVWFHNPDTTPAKLMPLDELISWKWMLNKKDITIVVAPEKGRDLNVREVSRRIMRLAERNTEAFQKANGKLAERIAAEAAIDGEIVTLTGTLATVQHAIEVAKVSKADTYSRAMRELMGELTAIGKQIEATAPGAKGGNTASLASLEALMNENDDIADKITALRGDEAAGRTSWAQWNKLRAGDNAEAWRGDAPAFDGKAGTVAEWGTGEAMPDFSGVAYDYMARAFVLTTLENGERTFNYLTASTYAAALIEAAELAAKLSVDTLVPEPEPEPAREAWRVEADAFGEGKPLYVGSRSKDAVEAIYTLPAGSWAFTQMSPGTFNAMFSMGNGKYASGDTHKTPKEAYESMFEMPLYAAFANENLKASTTARVDAAYLFENATDAFKAEVAESLDDEEYSPFVSAKNMDLAAKAAGASIAWSVGSAMLDGTEGDDTEVPGEDPDEEDFDADAEWDATPEEEVEEQLLDGDFVGHPFRGNQHAKSSHESGAAVGASMRAKHAERKGDAKASAKAHTSAHYSHKAASVSASGAAKKYHVKMAKFHGGRGGVSKLDSVVAVLDAAQKTDGMIIGKIKKGSTIVGRALIGGDGKAMVYVGKVGTERVVFASGTRAMWSDDDAGEMVTALLAPAKEVAGDEGGTVDIAAKDAAQKAAIMAALEALGWTRDRLTPEFARKVIGGGATGGMMNPEGNRGIIAKIVGFMLRATWGDDMVAQVTIDAGADPVSIAEKLNDAVNALDPRQAPNPAQKSAGSPLDAFEAAGGESWQVTKAKWVEIMSGHFASLGQSPDVVDFEEAHRGMVKSALDAGKPVPDNVLADYPDMIAETAEQKEARYAIAEANLNNLLGAAAGQLPTEENVPSENDWTRLRAAEKAAPSDSIFSDDPLIIEKLKLKLTALQMRQEFMKKANKFFKKPALGDDGLLAMGMSKGVIDGYRKPDFAGRIGFADYLLTNNNGVIASTRKRLEALLKAGAAAGPAAAKGDISYRAVDDMFTQFYPDSTAGEGAWKVMNENPDSVNGKVLTKHAASVIAQLRAAGYTVTEAVAPTESDDELLKALNEPASEPIPEGNVMEQYIKIAADSIAELRKVDVDRVLGSVRPDNIDGVTMQSLAAWISAERPDLAQEVNEVLSELLTPPVGIEANPEVPLASAEGFGVGADRAYLESLIDGSGDLLAEDTFTKLEPMFAKYEADAEMNALLERAATVYGDAAVAAAQSALATPA